MPSRWAIDAWAKRPVKSLGNINQYQIRFSGACKLTLPATPPMAWDAKISRVSSYPRVNLSWVAKLQTVPDTTPKRTAAAVRENVLHMSVTSSNTWCSLTRANKSRCRGDGDQTRDSAGAETDSRPLALQAVVPEHPSKPTNGGGEVGDDTCRCCTDIRGQGTTTVESEPTKPKEDGSKDNIGSVVGLVGELLSPITGTLSKVDGDGKSGGTGGDVDWGSTGEVETTLDE